MPRYDITRKSLQPVWAEDEDFGVVLELDAPVGARQENRAPDVKTVETALGAARSTLPRGWLNYALVQETDGFAMYVRNPLRPGDRPEK